MESYSEQSEESLEFQKSETFRFAQCDGGQWTI